jgi:hypothetical protein
MRWGFHNPTGRPGRVGIRRPHIKTPNHPRLVHFPVKEKEKV